MILEQLTLSSAQHVQTPKEVTKEVNNKRYGIFETIIFVFSFFASIAFVFVTKNYYILQILLQVDLDHHTSVLRSLLLYAYVFLSGTVIFILLNIFNVKQDFVKNFKRYLYSSVMNILLFMALCLYLIYFAKNGNFKKSSVSKISSKAYHFIVWFVLGSISSIIGNLFGQVLSIRTLKSFGQLVHVLCYLMTFSTLYSLYAPTQKDLFDMMI